MNLMEVQSRLNKLPPLPESIQYLTSAAQGGNPQVPPFMALARISEINKEIQSTQQAQPPAEPLNESLPKQALQSMGIGALQQGQQQQGMQQMAQQAGAAQRAVPPGIPQPVRQQQPQPQQPMPQQAPQGAQPVRMAAGGGLMGVPVDPRMFEYGSGGIVAFSGADGDQEVEEDDEDSVESGTLSNAAEYDAAAELRRLQPQFEARMKAGARPVRSTAKIEEELTARKDYGVDEGPVGKGYLEGLASLKEAKLADRAQRQANLDKSKEFITPRALLDYSDATRGQTGMGGIGALARSRMNATEKFMGEETNLRQEGIKVDELLNEAQYKVQALRQAQKSGDIKAEQKLDSDLAKIAKDLDVAKSNLVGKALSGNLGVIKSQIMADAQIQSAKERAKNKGAGGAKKPTDLGTSYEIELAALIAEGEPDDANTRKRAMNIAQDRLSKSASTNRVEVSKVEKANQEFLERYYTPEYSDLRKMRKKNPTEYAAGIAKLKNQIKNEFGIAPTVMSGGNAPAPADSPAPAAAPAVSSTPPVSKLKEGVATKFGNGQTWTLKNGQPVQVK
jgi:hypothetical protein